MYLLLVITAKKVPKPMIVTKLGFQQFIAWLGEGVPRCPGQQEGRRHPICSQGQVALSEGARQSLLVGQGGVR